MKDEFEDANDDIAVEAAEQEVESTSPDAPPEGDTQEEEPNYAEFVDDADGPHFNNGTKFDVDRIKASALSVLSSHKWKTPSERHDFIMDVCRVFGWPASDLNDKRDTSPDQEEALLDAAAERASALLTPKKVEVATGGWGDDTASETGQV